MGKLCEGFGICGETSVLEQRLGEIGGSRLLALPGLISRSKTRSTSLDHLPVSRSSGRRWPSPSVRYLFDFRGETSTDVLVNDELIIVAASFFQLSAMFLEPRCLFFQVTNTGPREGVSKHMRERYG